MSPLRLETERLTLVPATLTLLRAEVSQRQDFARLLQADVARPWPPPLNDDDSARWMIQYLEANPDADGWGMWYLLLRRRGDRPLAIGNAGFKGKPTAEGGVEIGYSIVEEHQRKGLGTEAARALVAHAFRDSRVARVIGETFPHLVPSIRVLEKNGFTRTGGGSEPGVIRFELKRETFEAGKDREGLRSQ